MFEFSSLKKHITFYFFSLLVEGRCAIFISVVSFIVHTPASNERTEEEMRQMNHMRDNKMYQ